MRLLIMTKATAWFPNWTIEDGRTTWKMVFTMWLTGELTLASVINATDDRKFTNGCQREQCGSVLIITSDPLGTIPNKIFIEWSSNHSALHMNKRPQLVVHTQVGGGYVSDNKRRSRDDRSHKSKTLHLMILSI